MGRVAFLFAGQGAQQPGMGRDLYETSETARRVFDEAERLKPGLLALCHTADAQTLAQTENAQPCLFAMDYACACLAREAGATPEALCGFSLGEWPAAAFSGLLSFEDAFRLTCFRASAMRACAARHPGAMYAVLKLDPDTVEALCLELDDAYPVNYNGPSQTVVACAEASAEPLIQAVKGAGGRAMRLSVSGAFHSPFMAEAALALREALKDCAFSEPRTPLYANRTAGLYTREQAGALLAEQVKSPVRFAQTIEAMTASGIDTFVEVGAGNTLSGLVARIAPSAKTYRVSDAATLAQFIECGEALS